MVHILLVEMKVHLLEVKECVETLHLTNLALVEMVELVFMDLVAVAEVQAVTEQETVQMVVVLEELQTVLLMVQMELKELMAQVVAVEAAIMVQHQDVVETVHAS
jgi:hypothetical protein